MPYSQMTSHYHLPRMHEMGIIYWCNTIGSLGISLVAIFVPIYLLRSGYSFTAVLIYLLLQQLFGAVLQYPASRLLRHVHPHVLLAAGTLIYALFFGLLQLFHTELWHLGLLALAWAGQRVTYWIAFHYVFGHARGHENSGRQIAGFQALSILAATLAPAVGGIIATVFGIGYIYIAAIVLLVAAVVPLISTAGEKPHPVTPMPLKKVWEMRRDILSNGCNGVVLTAELSLWPLLVSTLVSSYASVGILSALIALSAMLITLSVGRQKSSRDQQFIKRGLGVYSLSSLGRAVVQSTGQVFGLNLLAGIGRSLYVTPFMDSYYHNSDGRYRLGYITAMEMGFLVVSAIFLTLLILLSLVLSMTTVLAIGLGLVALLSLGVRLIRYV